MVKGNAGDKTIETKRQLAAAVVELCGEMPFSKIRVRTICEHAGVSRRTFYNHFRDKYELLPWQVQDGQNRMFRELGDDFPYRALIRGSFENIRDNEAMFRAALLRPEIFVAIGQSIIDESVEALLPRLEGCGIPEERLRFLLVYHFAANVEVMRRWFGDGAEEDPDVLTELIVQAMPEELKGVLG